jgi:hypothetical protein
MKLEIRDNPVLPKLFIVTPDSREPLSTTPSTSHILPAIEGSHSVARISEFKLGKVNLRTLAEPTEGTSSWDWWVINPKNHEKGYENFGRIDWNFQEVVADERSSSSIFLGDKGSLFFTKQLPLQELDQSRPINPGSKNKSGLIDYKPQMPTYEAFLEVGVGNKKRKIHIDPTATIFLQSSNGQSELFIPIPGIFLNSKANSGGRVNFISVSPESGIKVNSGFVNFSGDHIYGFKAIHPGMQRLLISEAVRHNWLY